MLQATWADFCGSLLFRRYCLEKVASQVTVSPKYCLSLSSATCVVTQLLFSFSRSVAGLDKEADLVHMEVRTSDGCECCGHQAGPRKFCLQVLP